MQMYYSGDESASNTVGYERSRMQKDMILQMLKKRGCRITKQRMMLLDIILEEDCSCCKEIYYKASKLDLGVSYIYVQDSNVNNNQSAKGRGTVTGEYNNSSIWLLGGQYSMAF